MQILGGLGFHNLRNSPCCRYQRSLLRYHGRRNALRCLQGCLSEHKGKGSQHCDRVRRSSVRLPCCQGSILIALLVYSVLVYSVLCIICILSTCLIPACRKVTPCRQRPQTTQCLWQRLAVDQLQSAVHTKKHRLSPSQRRPRPQRRILLFPVGTRC